MGKLNYDQSIEHFSHEHPLELSNIQPPSPNSASCAGCNLKPSEWFYTCKGCNFILHIQCSQIPQHIHHPADPNHALILQALPAKLQGLFSAQQGLLPFLSRPSNLERLLPICDACWEHVNGFYYLCSSCDLVLHILCASMPPSAKHQSHPHPLKLTYNPPYQTKGFSCDVCQKLGSKQWLYRCNACDFDAHLACVTPKPRVSEIQHQIRAPQPQAPLPNYNSFPGSHQPQFQRSGTGQQGNVAQQPNYYVNNQSVASSHTVHPAPTNNITEGGTQQVGQNLDQNMLGFNNNGADTSIIENLLKYSSG